MSPLKLTPRPPLPSFTFSPSPAKPNPSKGAMPSHPPADFFPERDMHTFGAHPLLGGRGERGRGLVSCGACARVTLESSWAEHQRVCKHILEGSPVASKGRGISGKSIKTSETKKRRASEDSDEELSRKKPKQPTDRNVNLLSASKSTTGGEDVSNKALKLKKLEIKRLNREKERLEKKEIKEKEKAEVAERKRQRVSGPINLDKQCGVINDKGQPCARSLTCKTHTVGAKRSVLGRTRNYDELYLEWQRANNPKFKEPTKIVTKKSLNSSSTGTKHNPGGGGGSKDKKKGDEDDIMGGRVLGEAEVRELVHFARSAGDRCRMTISSIGGKSNSTPKSPTAKARSSTMAKYRASHPSSRPGFCGNGGSGDSVWGGSMAFAGVGEALIQALSARPARIEPIRLVVPAPSAVGGGQSGDIGGGGGGVGLVPPPLAGGAGAAPGQQAKKQQRPTGISMPANQHQLQAQMAMQAQLQQAQAQLAQGLGQNGYPAHLQQQVQQLQGQGMSAQAMIAAAASAASAVNAGMAGLQGGVGSTGGMGQGQMPMPMQMQMQMQGAGGQGMSMLQQYQQGMMMQQQHGMMQAGQAGGGMYGQS